VHAITLDSRAGSAINRVLVRKNIIVRMGTPRFLRQGDEVTIPGDRAQLPGPGQAGAAFARLSMASISFPVRRSRSLFPARAKAPCCGE
jgi:uncharacterized protein YfaS (alpha-2-macroglobulin family)